MKNEELYPDYINYLNWKLESGKINRGKWSLLKMSRTSFNDFLKRIDLDPTFNEMIMEINKTETRDKKIKDIFDDID